MIADHAVKYASARDAVLEALRSGAWVSWRQLNAIAGVRYGARIRELKRLGYQIEATEREDHGRSCRLISPDLGHAREKRIRIYLDEQDALEMSRGNVTLTAIGEVRSSLQRFRKYRGRL